MGAQRVCLGMQGGLPGARSGGAKSRRGAEGPLPSPPPQVSTLSNGMRVATQASPGGSVCVGVFIKSGSRYETDESNGSAHFLEHMFFKGSTNTSQSQLEKKVEQMGCRLNAYTSREQTVQTIPNSCSAIPCLVFA